MGDGMNTWSIGTLYTTPDGRQFRAISFAKIVEHKLPNVDVNPIILRAYLRDRGLDPDNLLYLVYCAPDEATVVIGSGPCGSIEPMYRATVVGVGVSPLGMDWERVKASLQYGERIDFKQGGFVLAAWARESAKI